MTRLTIFVFAVVAIPAAAADRKDLKPGLVATYTDPAGATARRLEPTVAAALAAGESHHPNLAPGGNVAWAGYLNVVTPGVYTFAANVTGELAVTVGDVTFTLAGTGGGTRVAVPVELKPGVLPFTATFKQTGPAGRVELLWQGPGFRREPVPHLFFGHLPAERPKELLSDLAKDHGRLLFEELACARCHTTAAKNPAITGIVDRGGPNLSEIAGRVYPGWLDAWLADPAKLRPHTSMPNMFADSPEGVAERRAVVQYLLTLGKPLAAAKSPGFSNDFRKSVAAGETLFATSGCATCHGKQLASTPKKSDDDDDDAKPKFDPADSFHGLGSATGPQSLYALGAVGSKTTPAALAKYLQDPLATNPHGRMPRMQLSDADARNLANHLTRLTDDAIPKTIPDSLPSAKLGEKLFASKGCVNCHVVEAGGKPVAVTTVVPSFQILGKPAAAGCVAEKPDPAKVPVYTLDAGQKAALVAFLGSAKPASSAFPAYAARAAIKRFACLNCHQRDGEGGIGLLLGDQMKMLENAQNADDVQPPRLTGVGHKSRTEWLQSVLVGGGRARPWMTLRMPQYGDANVSFLPHALAAAEGTTPDGPAAKPALTPQLLDAGKTLVGKAGLGCVACHDISGTAGGGTRGPDLALTSRRVRRDWYDRWMHNPQRVVPGTRMPQYFLDGKSPAPAVIGGDPEKQIAALWAYMDLGPGLPLPAGMEPPKGLIVAVAGRPEILRTFLPDNTGTRAIAVGFPGGLNLAFDAHAGRTSYAWEGNFLDASPVWDNRGGAPAKLLGPKYFTSPAGNPWAVTDSRRPPDFAKRAADPAYGAPVPNNEIYQGKMRVAFLGYALDGAGNPTFRYRVGDADGGEIRVAESPLPVRSAVANGVTRAMVVDLPAGKAAWFLAGDGPGTPRAYDPAGKSVKLDLKDADAETPAAGVRVVLPQANDKAVVLTLSGGPAAAAWRFAPRPGGGWQAMLRLPEPKDAATLRLAVTAWAVPRDDEPLILALPPGK